MKRLLLTALTALAALGAAAQMRYAATAGVNLSTLSFNQDLVPVSSTAGYTAGVQGEMMFPGIGFGIDLGLLYNQVGAKVDLGSKNVWEGLGAPHLQLHYIQVPFHLRFKWTRMDGLERTVAPFVYGGPEFSILAGHTDCDAVKYSGTQFSLTAGAGAELFERWQIAGSYTWGMSNALTTYKLDDFAARNRTWSIRLSYYF